MIQSNSGKLLGCSAVLCMAWLGSAPWVFGETCGPPGLTPCCNTRTAALGGQCAAPANIKYEITIKRFCLELSNGTLSCVGSQTTFNFADAAIDTTFANFVTNEPFPNAAVGDVVSAVRPEVFKRLTVDGSGQGFHTTIDAVACASGEQTADADTGGAQIPSCSDSPNQTCETSDGAIRIRDTSVTPFTLTAAPLVIQFFFDVGSGVIFDLAVGACTFSSPGPLLVQMVLP